MHYKVSNIISCVSYMYFTSDVVDVWSLALATKMKVFFFSDWQIGRH